MFDCYGALQSIEAMCKDMVQPDGLCQSDDSSVCESRTSPALAEEASPRRDEYPQQLQQQEEDEQLPAAGGAESSGSCSASAQSRPARTVFSSWQLQQLEREYASSRYLSSAQRRQLSARLALAEPTVKVWFQNRRMKEKRQASETQVLYLNQLMHSYMYGLAGLQTGASSPPRQPHHQLLPQLSPPGALTPMYPGAAFPQLSPQDMLSPQLSPPDMMAPQLSPTAFSTHSFPQKLSRHGIDISMSSSCSDVKPLRPHRHLFRPYAL